MMVCKSRHKLGCIKRREEHVVRFSKIHYVCREEGHRLTDSTRLHESMSFVRLQRSYADWDACSQNM